MKFSYSTANLIFFGFLIILLILSIFDRHKIGKFLGNPAGKIFERQTKATLEVKTRHFVTTFEGQKQRYSLLTRYLSVFSHGTLSICRETLFLSSYMPCSVHFVGNRLLTNDILRLVISILFVSCRRRKCIQTSQLFSGALARAKRAQRSTMGNKIW